MSPRKGVIRLLSAAGGVWALNIAIVIASAAVLAGLVGPVVVLLFDRKLPAIKFVFNIAQFTLTTCLAVIVFRLLAATVEGFGPPTWIFALLATQASAVITVTLIGAAISLSEGLIGARALGRMLMMDLTV